MTIEDEVTALWSLDTAALRARYCALFNREPRVGNSTWIRRRIAWELQARAYGGLSTTARQRIDELVKELKLPFGDRTVTGKAERRQERYGLSPGTTIVRHWHDRELHLRVLDDGFEIDGVRYPTLTAAAKGVTGAHWNGALFFGVKARRKSS
jgi:hypothetical protein